MAVQNVTVRAVNQKMLIIGRKRVVCVAAGQVNEWFMVDRKTIVQFLAIHAKKKIILIVFEMYVRADCVIPVSAQTMLSKAQLHVLHANHVQ